MDWLQKLDPKEAIAWQELMIDYAYIPEEWEAARAQLFAMLQQDQRSTKEEDARLISPVVLSRWVQLILYPNYLKQLLNFIRGLGWKVAKKCKGPSSVNYDEHPSPLSISLPSP